MLEPSLDSKLTPELKTSETELMLSAVHSEKDSLAENEIRNFNYRN
jgi:hypothetical protein